MLIRALAEIDDRQRILCGRDSAQPSPLHLQRHCGTLPPGTGNEFAYEVQTRLRKCQKSCLKTKVGAEHRPSPAGGPRLLLRVMVRGLSGSAALFFFDIVCVCVCACVCACVVWCGGRARVCVWAWVCAGEGERRRGGCGEDEGRFVPLWSPEGLGGQCRSSFLKKNYFEEVCFLPLRLYPFFRLRNGTRIRHITAIVPTIAFKCV